MKRSLLAVPTALVLSLASLSGCADERGSDRVQVVAGFYALEYVAKRIGGDDVEVTGLTQPGQEPHDAELTVPRTAAVLDADLVLLAKGFQPAVDEAAADAPDDAVVDALSVLSTRDPVIEGGSFDRPVTALEDDPHFWLDPRAVAIVAAEVKDRLQAVDPERADAYETRFLDLRADLVDLDARYAQGLQDCELRTVVTSHDAFGYLGYRYDIDLEPIAGLSPGAEPSPRQLADLADLIRQQGITTVFTETLVSPELADALADELGLAAAVLDPIEGLSEETADEDYLSLMRSDLAALEEANRCR